MNKATAVMASLFISAFAITNTVSAASMPKPGTKCAKAGQTQTIAGKKFTCTKSGSKLAWNRGVGVVTKATPIASTSADPIPTPAEPSATPSATPSASTASTTALIKYKNCAEVKAAGAAPLTKSKTPELYELNAGLDRDKDGVSCE